MRRALFVVALLAPSCMVGLVLVQGCLGPEPPLSADAGDAATDASQSTSDATADTGADAKTAVPCDAAPPSAQAFHVQCLDDGGTCTPPSMVCCQTGATFNCQASTSCTGGFACDKATDCSAGICCASLSTPDTSTCPASSETTTGTSCANTTSCGIGQLELCVLGQGCKDPTTKCKLVSVGVNAGSGFIIGHRTLGVCY